MFKHADSGKRIALWSAVSLGLHALLIGAFMPVSRPLQIASPSAAMQWVELAPAPRATAVPRRPTRPSGVLGVQQDESPARGPVQQESPTAPVLANAPDQTSRHGVSIVEALASARVIARETTGREKPLPADAEALPDRPFLPQLDHALRREAPSERHLANGLIRIVSADGRIYCLQTPPDFARGGPVEMLMVPTNCP